MINWVAPLLLLLSVSAHAEPLVFMADLNGRYGSVDYHPRITEAVSKAIEMRPAAVVIAGDMIAGQARPPLKAAQLQRMWASFDRTVHRPLRDAGIPVLAVPGNHDASIYPSFALERDEFESYWQRYEPGALHGDSNFPWYFALDAGAFRLVGLDVTAPGPLPAAQETFLQQQRVAAQNEQQTLVVITHLPRYPLAEGRETETFEASSPGIGEIWVSGHHHAFFDGVTSAGVRHIGVPALGGNRRFWLGTHQKSPFGFVTIAADGATELRPWPGYTASSKHLGPKNIGPLRNTAQTTPTLAP